jgi:pyruvate dehydrogenase E1 component beta subunit
MVLLCIKAAQELAQRGIRVELIDLRTIKPLDIATIANSVRKTHHAVLVEEGHYFAGICSEVAYEIQEHCFDFLDAPIKRVSQCETPMPYSKTLERETMPTVEKIVAAVLESINIK